jgi:peptidoglycan/LPS O-acetylase OafA/YrhL
MAGQPGQAPAQALMSVARARVPDAVAAPPRHPRFPLVDGTRAMAVLTVVAVHSAVFGNALGNSLGGRLLAHLNIGVAIFFLISGFLLYRPFIAHRTGGPGAPAIRDYAKRRFLRIYPAYWLVLTVLVVVPGVTGVVNGGWPEMYALLHALAPGRGCTEQIATCGLAQTWSLVVELTFYALLPIYALGAARLTGGLEPRRWMRRELALLAVLAALSVALLIVVSEPLPKWLIRTALGYGLWFAFGMSMAVVSVRFAYEERLPRPLGWLAARPEVAWLAAVCGYVVLCLSVPATPFLLARGPVLAVHVAFGVISAFVLFPAVFTTDRAGFPGRVLAHPVVAWLGLVSYGIFLWHYVVTLELGSPGAGAPFVVVLAGTLAIATGCAAVSYYVVERPLLRLKNRPLWGLRRQGERPYST